MCSAIAFPLAATITGTVVNANGAPISDVRVAAFRPITSTQILRNDRRDPLVTTSTNKDGQFSLAIAGYGLVDIEASKNGYAPANIIVATDEPAGAFVLRPANEVEAQVTANGKPVANAKVFVIATADPIPLRTTTNSEGKYHVPDPRAWAQTIIVFHPDFAPAWHPATEPDFVLSAGEAVHGKVIDANGRPVSGATLEVADGLTATTDAEGKFTIRNAPRQQGMLIRAHGDAGVAIAQLSAGTPTVKLQPATQVSGIVRDDQKHPLAGVPVTIGGQNFEDSIITDVNGAYAIDVPRGKYQFFVFVPSGQFVADVADLDATQSHVTRDIIAKRQVPTEGSVRTEDGKAVAGAAISFLTDSRGMSGVEPTGTVTGIDGAFRVYGQRMHEEKARLLAVKPGMPPAVSAPLATGSHASRVSITIPSGTLITGTVLGKGRKPIAGARVDPIIGSPRPMEMSPQTPIEEPWATTDQEGRFSGRLSETTKGLSFAKKGYVTAEQVVGVQGQPKPMEVTLNEAGSIAGRVVNKDGSAAADVMVSAGSAYVMSTSKGAFIIEALEPGPQIVRFGRTFQQQTITAPATNVTLILVPTRSVHGRVIDAVSGAPVEKFAVSSSATNEMATSMPFESTSGEFKFEIPASATTLLVEAPGYAPSNDVHLDPSGDAALTIKLSRGRTLRGRVVDEKQQPIAGVMVGTDRGAAGPDSLQTQPDGSFELTGVAFDEDVRVQFLKEGYVHAERKLKAGREDATLEVTLRRGIGVVGRVVDRSGAGVGGVQVTVSSAVHGAEYESAETDASGVFHFDALAPAHYDFNATHAETGQRGRIKDVDIEKVRDLSVQLEKVPTGIVFGHVSGLNSGGANRFVSIMPSAAEPVMAPIDVSGNFRADNVPAGTAQVMAEVFGTQRTRTSKSVTIDVAAGSESRVDLVFAPQVAVRGHVLRGEGPIASASIFFSGTGSITALTGANGTYETALDAGEYDVTIKAPDGTPMPFAQHISVSDAAEFDFRIDPITLNATVLDAESQQPIGGATVSASHHGETHTVTTAMTAADGTASLELSRGEIMTIVASKTGFANASEDVPPVSNRSIVLRLARSAGAVVRIIDVRNGSTLSGYVIARDSSGRVVASANETDPDGTVTLPLAAGKYLFSASAEGFGSHTATGEVPSGEIRVPLPRGGNLSIRSNTDVRGTARLIQPNGEEYVRCWCNGIAQIKIDSRATLVDRISPGQYTLEVILTGAKPKHFPVSIVEGQTAVVAID
jgi:hypothetical protein